MGEVEIEAQFYSLYRVIGTLYQHGYCARRVGAIGIDRAAKLILVYRFVVATRNL
jgi:hypothetical protein